MHYVQTKPCPSNWLQKWMLKTMVRTMGGSVGQWLRDMLEMMNYVLKIPTSKSGETTIDKPSRWHMMDIIAKLWSCKLLGANACLVSSNTVSEAYSEPICNGTNSIQQSSHYVAWSLLPSSPNKHKQSEKSEINNLMHSSFATKHWFVQQCPRICQHRIGHRLGIVHCMPPFRIIQLQVPHFCKHWVYQTFAIPSGLPPILVHHQLGVFCKYLKSMLSYCNFDIRRIAINCWMFYHLLWTSLSFMIYWMVGKLSVAPNGSPFHRAYIGNMDAPNTPFIAPS